DADRWEARGLDLLCRELKEQVLPDGGHFERSPYYHLRMTRLATEVVDLLAAFGRPVPPELAAAARKMRHFHLALRHQDGGLPLFHDSLGSDSAEPPAADDAACSFPATGYYLLEGPEGRLIADYGAPGDCYNPAHQHAGIFSFEISCGSRRVVVDSGTETYDPGPRRDRLRSTAAHNTVRVDGRDQFQVWHGFRVGRRAWVSGVEERHEPHFQALSAVHNGYTRRGVDHRRSIVYLPGAGWLIADDVTGRGSHRLESFLHLHPEIAVTVEAGRVSLMPLGWVVLPFGPATSFEIIPDTYSPAPGRAQPSETLVFQAGPGLPCRFGYFLAPLASARLVWDGGTGFRIETPAREWALRLDLDLISLAGLRVSYN
ncbi:MAG: alginate lyase family protein, partial [Acidobacteria bacterium]|nr:alginate lyase family protein [Acidobacteriota bacterium]